MINKTRRTLFFLAIPLVGCASDVAVLAFENSAPSLDSLATAAFESPVRSLSPAGDLDGDGAPDLVAVTVTGVDLLYGGALPSGYHPDATLQVLAAGAADAPTVTRLGDLDGDHRDDLAIVRQAGCVFNSATQQYESIGAASVFVLYGGPRLTGERPVAQLAVELTEPVSCAYLRALPAGDLDGDGHADLAVARTDTSQADRLAIVYGATARLTGSSLAQASAQISGYSGVFSLGDFDGDHRADLGFTQLRAAPEPDEEIVVFSVQWGGGRLSGDVTLGALPSLYTDDVTPELHRLGDIDGDGREDYFFNDLSGGASLVYGRARAGTGGPLEQLVSARLAPIAGHEVGYGTSVAGDLDGDGANDLALALTPLEYAASKTKSSRVGVADSAALHGDGAIVDHDPPLVGGAKEVVIDAQPFLELEHVAPVAILDFDRDGLSELWVFGTRSSGGTPRTYIFAR